MRSGLSRAIFYFCRELSKKEDAAAHNGHSHADSAANAGGNEVKVGGFAPPDMEEMLEMPHHIRKTDHK